MSKKKDKTFSYNNTHGHGVYPPVYPVGQRYPHTDFHHNDPFWIYEELGILKDWIISLTKLGGMLAQTENNDTENLVNEISTLINKLNNFTNKIIKSLLNLYDKEEDYDKDLIENITTITTLTENLSHFIDDLSIPIYSLFNCIENHLKNIDIDTYKNFNSVNVDIANIEEEINEIFNYIESQYETNSKKLTQGTDFDVTFFNGFYLNEEYYGEPQTIHVRLLTQTLLNTNFYNILIETSHSTSNNYAISNSYTYTTASENDSNAPLFRHGNSWRDTPQSWIFFIKFKGDYSYLNNLTFLKQNEIQNGIWNMSPSKARPSWIVNVNSTLGDIYTNDKSINLGNGILAVMTSISDGINTQYYDYCNLGLTDSLSFGHILNINISLYLSD